MALIDAESCADLVASGYSQDGSDLNLASIAIADLIVEQTVTHKVSSVTSFTAKYRASVTAPEVIRVSVSPKSIRLRPGETADYHVTFQTQPDALLNEWAFGDLVWTDGCQTFTWHHQLMPYQKKQPPLTFFGQIYLLIHDTLALSTTLIALTR